MTPSPVRRAAEQQVTMATMFAGQHFYPVSSGDKRAFSLFLRHYSARPNRAKRIGKNSTRFVPPGENLVLMTASGDALFVWSIERWRRDGQEGVNCSVFRNESNVLSSELILEAEQLAWRRWPGERLFTFVDPKKISSSNPGYCFKVAGWNECGITKTKKLVILEKMP